MVGMAMTFGSADYVTPHGGEPFHYWKRGYGFGHARGAGKHLKSPSVPALLRFTPKGDRAYASSAFWRRKHELGQASSFGIGDRPELARGGPGDSNAGPDNYGDVSFALHFVRRNATRSGISLKPRFPSMEERYRDLSWPEAGPGPAKYNTCIEAGKSSWINGTPMPAWTCQARGISGGEIREHVGTPGPPDYGVRGRAGTRCPVRRGTLRDVTFKGRLQHRDVAGDASPGPARYSCNGLGGTMPMHGRPLDDYGLWDKIRNVKVSAYRRPKRDKSADGGQGSSDLPDDEVVRQQPSLTRMRSAPV